MTEREEAVLHFQWLKKRLCEEWQKFIPEDSIAYMASKREEHYYDMAVSALSAEGEYIKKEDALDKIVEQLPQRAYMKCQKAIESLPTYSFPDREKGEWILTDDEQSYVCSCCHNHWISKSEWLDNWNYCPNCGADMKGKADE